jgi:nicotinamide riboside transporter PnuC
MTTFELWGWVLSITGLVGIWLAGDKRTSGWVILLVSEVLWVVYALTTGQPGFLLGSVAWGLVYVRNIAQWRREKRAHEALRDAQFDLALGLAPLAVLDVDAALHELET